MRFLTSFCQAELERRAARSARRPFGSAEQVGIALEHARKRGRHVLAAKRRAALSSIS